MASPMVPSK
ncbi:hypothetical protein OIU76_023329, partial [Salix suchowensis]